MDEDRIKNSIQERFNNLQPEIQAAIMDPNYEKTLGEISQKYNLSAQEFSELELNTTLVLIGQTHPDKYMDELSDDLKIPKEKIEAIVMEVNEKILKNIVYIIRKNFDADDTEEQIISDLPDSYYEEGYFAKLPKEVQAAIRESNYRTKLYQIAVGKDMSIEQMQVLEELTNKVLLNVIHPDKYEEELTSKLGLKPDIVSDVVSSVNEDILKNIRDILRSHWEENRGLKINDDDEVPLPPYAIAKPQAPKTFTTVIPKSAEIVPKTESGIYKSAGIEMMKDEPEKEDVMRSIIGSKLSAPTISKPLVSNQTIPKINPVAPVTPKPLNITQPQIANPAEKPHDPYHEAV